MRDAKSLPGGPLTIRLFGGMEILDANGVSYLPRSRKTRAIVAILASLAPRPVERMQIVRLLWSQRESDQARASLRQAVHELRAALGSSWSRILLAGRYTLALDLSEVTVDVRSASGPGASQTELLMLFENGFLEELRGLDHSFDNWLGRERGRLENLARDAGADFLLTRHSTQETVQAAKAVLRIEPRHDGAWRALLQAHAEAGERTAARRAIDQWRDAMGLAACQETPAEMNAFLAQIEAVMSGDHAGTPEVRAMPAERLTPSLATPPGDIPRLSSPRLGVHDMRVVGLGIDPGLPIGLTEEITTALSGHRWISCVSGVSLAIAGAAATDHEPADPDLTLDGTIQRVGDRVRIMARLMDMRVGGAVIWAERFELDGSDALKLQERVAACIVAQIDTVLLMREGERAAANPSPGASARDLVLQAVPSIYRLDRMSFHAAGDKLEAALRLEPGNADALAWFAYWHLFLVGQGWTGNPEAATARAGRLADAAVAADPSDARALTLAGHVGGFLMKRPVEAGALHDRAISLNPNLALAWCFSGFALTYVGDHEAALTRMRQAIELAPSDPHSFFFHSATIMPQLLRGEYLGAADAGRRAIQLNPWFSSSFKGQLSVLGHLGLTEEAARIRTTLLKLEPGFTVRDAIHRSPMREARDIERYASGLRLAGLAEQ